MNFLKNFEFGELKGAKMSHLGLALGNAEGTMVSYYKAKQEIVDVDLIDFPAEGMVYKMPVAMKDISVGDIIIHNKMPMFVTSVDKGIKVIVGFVG